MKVFYWTEPHVLDGSRFYQADTELNFFTEIAPPPAREAIIAMIDDSYIEISWRTAYQLSLPT